MPKVIKYSTATPSGSLRKGNMAVGVGNYDYGTSFYTAVEPPDGGYTVYENKATGGPSIRVASNEAELINLTREASSTTYTTAAECLAWFATQTDKIVIASSDSIPNVVTDGLVLNLNAGMISSYPTTGSTWYDLSGNATNGTLTNGPTFDSDGAIVFDGVDDYTQLNQTVTLAGEFTLNLLIFPTSTNTKVLLGNNGIDYLQINNASALGLFSSAQSITLNGYSWDTTKPSMVTVTRNSSNVIQTYKNGISSVTGSLTGDFRIRQIGQRGNSIRFYEGNIYSNQIYNKALSQSEILQNYYQAPIVTDGLVFAVDAGNLVSYENGSTTTYSLTGSLSGSLVNGTGYSSDNGGTWVFDGVDDRLTYGSPNIDQSCTFNQWIQPSSGSATTMRTVFYEATNSATAVIISQLIKSSNIWYHQILISGYPAGYAAELNTYFQSNVTQFVQNNTPYNFTFTWERTPGVGSTLKTYLNGVYRETDANTNTYWANTASLATATYIIENSYKGNIGTTSFYNRALTADEVAQNFNAQRNRFGI